ncbi:hypothetical protein C0Q70_10622 [Pomacea canaliculata]|uniref:Uncharacterized protein n=1 Tax=Pomacea canaliculata TaxID=400727 RepID=A0A2T7P3Q7_POMCA|nr:hypothetical protein C0Q70_10622 [Pomacea canaliculata]
MLKTDSEPCEDANHLRHLEAVTDKGRNRHDEGVVIGWTAKGLTSCCGKRNTAENKKIAEKEELARTGTTWIWVQRTSSKSSMDFQD